MPETSGCPDLLARGTHRIAAGDVDGAALIYFAAPFPWSEALMSDWMARELRPLSEMFADRVAVPVVSTKAEFRAPLKQDEIVDLRLRAAHIGRTSFTLRTEAWRDGELAVVVETVHVFVTGLGEQLRPTPLPDEFRSALERGLVKEVAS